MNGIYISFTSFLLYFAEGCSSKNPEVKAFLDNITFPTLKEIRKCLKRSKELMCHLYHPVCLHSINKWTSNNQNYSYMVQKVCKATCITGEKMCHKIIKFLKTSNYIRLACQKFSIANHLFLDLPSCENLPQADIRYIEQCRKLKFTGNKFFDMFTI